MERYLVFEVFELENGWLLKINYPSKPHNFDATSYKSFYHPSIKSLTKQMESEAYKNKRIGGK